MAWQLAAFAGMQAASGIFSYFGDKAAAKAAKALRSYNNVMTRLSAAQSQNELTDNEIIQEDIFKEQEVAIQQQERSTLGAVEVTAAAAGVAGRSVSQAMDDVARNAARAERQRQINLEISRAKFDASRAGIEFSATMNQDLSYIPKPSLTSYLVGAGANIMQTSMALQARGSDKPATNVRGV